jgi:hypothetical protein
MDLVLKSIRNKLAEDPTLTETVSAYDITTGYNAESANYPCVLLGISAGGAGNQIAGIAKAILTINVCSKVSKQQLWTIYSRIKTLIHNNELGVTNAQRTFHAINEIFVDENKYDKTHNVWQITARYNILYGASGLSLTTGATGAIYADRNSVTVNPEKEIAKFRGPVSLNISFDHDVRMSQERFGKAVYYKSGTAKLTIGEVIFKPSVLELLWNIDTNTNGKLNDSLTLATTYQLGQYSSPAYLQVLFQMLKTDDGKKLEIEASKAVCHNLTIPFSKKDFSVFNCEWILLSDNNDNVVKVSIEN